EARLEPAADALLAQHAADREMPPDLAQEVEMRHRLEPLGVVDNEHAVGRLREDEKPLEDPGEALLVRRDRLLVEKRAGGRAARRIAHARRAAAEKNDRPVSCFLQAAQHHDREEMPDMKAVGGAVEAGEDGARAGREESVEPRGIGAILDEATRL